MLSESILQKIIRILKRDGPILPLIKLVDFLLNKYGISFLSFFSRDIYGNKLTTFSQNSIDIKKEFSNIYEKNLWGSSESVSGPGSTAERALDYSNKFRDFLINKNIKSFFDLPCGDFNWMKKTLDGISIDYLGGDIVADLIIENNKNYPNFKFIEFDITKDNLPDVDLLHCRDCFLHFSYEDIIKSLKNFSISKIEYILLTNHESILLKNNDIMTGGVRLLDLRKKPFFLEVPILKIKDFKFKKDFPKYLYLYNRDQINKILLKIN